MNSTYFFFPQPHDPRGETLPMHTFWRGIDDVDEARFEHGDGLLFELREPVEHVMALSFALQQIDMPHRVLTSEQCCEQITYKDLSRQITRLKGRKP